MLFCQSALILRWRYDIWCEPWWLAVNKLWFGVPNMASKEAMTAAQRSMPIMGNDQSVLGRQPEEWYLGGPLLSWEGEMIFGLSWGGWLSTICGLTLPIRLAMMLLWWRKQYARLIACTRTLPVGASLPWCTSCYFCVRGRGMACCGV